MANKTGVHLTTTKSTTFAHQELQSTYQKKFVILAPGGEGLRQVDCEFYGIVSSRLAWATGSKLGHNLTSQEMKVEHTQRKRQYIHGLRCPFTQMVHRFNRKSQKPATLFDCLFSSLFLF